MPESVWISRVAKSSIDVCLKRFKVSNVKTVPGGAELRIISRKQPTENAAQVDATLEDVFLYYFGERAGDEDAAV